MLTPRLLDLACAIQQIPAPTFAEHARAQFVRDQFLAVGLVDVEIDELDNVFGRRPGGDARPLLISAHTDTVFPADTPLDLTRAPDRISGPGIGDNSLGVAGLMGLLWALNGEPLPGDLYLAANVCEEGLGDLRGMRRVIDKLGDKVRATVVLEGLAFGHIYHAGIGVRRYRFTTHAAGGHSYLHFGQPSAIHALVRFAAQLTELGVPLSPKTTFNIGTLSGGSSVNTIAREATLDLDLRSEDPATLAALVARVEELAGAFDGHGAQMETKIIGDRASGSIPREHPLVQLAIRAYAEIGVSPSFEAGSTDANIPLSRGLPCICVGLAQGSNAHRPDEYIETKDVGRGLEVLTKIVRSAFEV
jgi:acetylornithine deacetylase/succinyl-diaminopimelate desuccinylase-like protein